MNLLTCICVCISIFTWRQNIGMRSNWWEMLFRKSFAMEIVLNRRYLCSMRFGYATQRIHPLLTTGRVWRTNFQRITGYTCYGKCSRIFFTWIYNGTGQMFLKQQRKWKNENKNMKSANFTPVFRCCVLQSIIDVYAVYDEHILHRWNSFVKYSHWTNELKSFHVAANYRWRWIDFVIHEGVSNGAYSMINKRRLCETHLPPWRTTDVTQWRWTIGSTVNSGCAGSIQIETPMTTYHAMTIGCNIIGRCGPIVRWQEVAQNARLSVDCKPSILPTYLTCENKRKNYQKKCCD